MLQGKLQNAYSRDAQNLVNTIEVDILRNVKEHSSAVHSDAELLKFYEWLDERIRTLNEV